MAIGKGRAILSQFRTLFNLGAVRELTDGQLLERFATDHGEAAELAFAVLVERHGPMVLRVCQAVLRDPHDTQDAFQATFLVLIERARGLWVRDSLGPWLHQVAYRTASCARANATRRRRLERSVASSMIEGRGPKDEELGRILHEEIDRLPDRYRVPVVLCDLEGRSHEQAARHLGWPVGTVKSRLSRGRDRLRDRLRRRGVAPDAGPLDTAIRPVAPDPALLPPALLESTTVAAAGWVTAQTIGRGSAATLAREVLRAMSMTRWLKVTSALLVAGATASGVNLLAQKEAPVAERRPETPAQAPRAYDGPVHEVRPGKLIVNVIEPGFLESASSADLYCQVEGQTTILSLVPEGSRVKKGDRVCELDSASLRDRLINQRITAKGAEATFRNAARAREIAEIAVREYVEGTYQQEDDTLQASIAAARSAIRKAENRLERTRRARQQLTDDQAVRKDARTSADIVAGLDLDDRIEAAEQVLEREKAALELARSRRRILEQFTRPRSTKEREIDLEQKRATELAKHAAWELEESKIARLERQIAACVLTAPVDGLVVYANDPNRIGQTAIEEGATVRERQKILSLPDLSRLQVNAKVDEASIEKVVTNLKARIRVHAFADQVLNGRVLDVAPLPDPANFFSFYQKVYTTRVAIANRLPGLRPGMSAQVEILVADLDNVLNVPLPAVLHYDGKDHVAVKKPDGRFEWREVTRGVSNDRSVEVTQGINAGEILALQPKALMSEEEQRAKFWDAADATGTGPGVPTRRGALGAPGDGGDPAKAEVKAKGKGARGVGNPLFQKFQKIRPEDRARMKSAGPEERMEILKRAGFTDEELRRLGILGGGRGRPGGGPPAATEN